MMSFQITCSLLMLLLSPVNSLSHSSSYYRKLNSFFMKSSESVAYYKEVTIESLKGIHFTDITPHIRQAINDCGVYGGQANIISKHTTAAITINELESRLVDDTRQYLLKLAPAAYPYLHNDLHLRSGPPNWPGGDEVIV